MTTPLTEQKCQPCEKGTAPLQGESLEKLLNQLDDGWEILEGKKLAKEYKFKNFLEALEFTNRVGECAESEGHHPDIFLTWGKVRLTLWTHTIGGLSENDFILAAKADAIL